MTATDELRRLLDERGVEWTYGDGTVSYANGEHWCHAWSYSDDAMCVSMGYFTPEQAIAATLGGGTCEMDVLDTGNEAAYEHYEYIMHCANCHHEFGYVQYNEDGDTWQDEKPAFCPQCGKAVKHG